MRASRRGDSLTWHIMGYRSSPWPTSEIPDPSPLPPCSNVASTALIFNELCASYFRVFIYTLPTFFCLNIPPPKSLGLGLTVIFSYCLICMEIFTAERTIGKMPGSLFCTEGWVSNGGVTGAAKGLLLLFVEVMHKSVLAYTFTLT